MCTLTVMASPPKSSVARLEACSFMAGFAVSSIIAHGFFSYKQVPPILFFVTISAWPMVFFNDWTQNSIDLFVD